MKRGVWVVLCTCIFSVALGGKVATRTVSTPCGPVVGVEDDTFAGLWAFKGIPFAQPPVGAHRWQPPVSMTNNGSCWSGAYDAQTYRPACPQVDHVPGVEYSEDCLFLNVWTKHPGPSTGAHPDGAAPTSGQPIMVFFYGGDNTAGAAQYYNQTLLAAEGDIVLVTINYRVNLFGFLALDALSEVDPRGVSGNYGILDQVQALKWIQTYAKSFGGDPNRVTIFGQSSGGTDILALLAVPSAKGLFHAAISLSGSPNITMDYTVASQENLQIATTLGCQGSNEVVRVCLLSKTTAELVAAIPSDWDGSPYGYSFPAVPVPTSGFHYPGIVIIDGVTVTQPLIEALEAGVVDVPLIIGSMQQETALFPDRPQIANWTSSDVTSFLESHYGPWGPAAGSTIANFYKSDITSNPPSSYLTMSADATIACGSIVLARAAAKGFKSQVFYRHATGGPTKEFIPGDPLSKLAFHAWDLVAATGDWNQEGVAYTPSPGDQNFGATLRRAWLALAYDGEISPKSGWSTISAAGNYTGVVVDDLGAKSVVDLLSDTCGLWTSIGIGQPFWWCN